MAGLSGRTASMHRRQLLSAGKQALQSGPSASSSARVRAAPQPAQPAVQATAPSPALPSASGREQARARRALQSQQGRGSAPPAPPTRERRRGTLEYAPKVVTSTTQSGQRVTGLRIGQGAQMTGDDRGTGQPVSGTQYIGTETAAAWRAGGPKVGLARTEAGQVVSGTLIRSAVRVTGDEAGGRATITGKADQRPEDDLTSRAAQGASTAAQFQRQASPHGSTVFGTNLGRSAGQVGSRDRTRAPALEMTESGLPITGSALGRSVRLTGDEGGACRHVTGTQYLAPARRQAECGFTGGGTAPAEQVGADRPDPVTGTKVAVARSWGGQRVTGMDVEHNPRVTGDAPGSCAVLTGSQYQGRSTAERWCDAGVAENAAAAMDRRAATAAVTGDTAQHDAAVTGTARGAARDITGTPYYRASPEASAPAADPVAQIDGRFSIRSPQRAAHLRADPAEAQASGPRGRITGSFALGGGKITGNLEFLGRKRAGGNHSAQPAHLRVSGEGRVGSAGPGSGRITGDSWADQRNVTGTEGSFAAGRNPTERSGEPQAFAGAATFKGQAKQEEARQLVTGMFGYFSKSGAKVTMSGGAQS